MDGIRGDDHWRAGALLFFACALFGFRLFLLPLEFVAGELKAGKAAESADELEPELGFFLEGFAQVARIEAVEDVEEYLLSDGNARGVEIVERSGAG
jgi:hypothetical protein